MAVGWLVGGWGLVGVPVLSVQFNRSILSVQAGVPGSRSRQAFMAGVGWRMAVGWRLVVSWRALACVQGGRSRRAFKACVGGRWIGWRAVVGDNKRGILRWHYP